jgi:hypothetical protein
MNDEMKLGLAAGILAVIGVAMFGLPRGTAPIAAVPSPAVSQSDTPPPLPPASVTVPAVPTAFVK